MIKKRVFIILLCVLLVVIFSIGAVNKKEKNTFIELQSQYTMMGNQENQPYWVLGAMTMTFIWMLTLYQIEKVVGDIDGN